MDSTTKKMLGNGTKNSKRPKNSCQETSRGLVVIFFASTKSKGCKYQQRFRYAQESSVVYLEEMLVHSNHLCSLMFLIKSYLNHKRVGFLKGRHPTPSNFLCRHVNTGNSHFSVICTSTPESEHISTSTTTLTRQYPSSSVSSSSLSRCYVLFYFVSSSKVSNWCCQ